MEMEYRPAYPKRILEQRKSNIPFKCHHFVSPYIGCEYGCVYCNGCMVLEHSKNFQKIVQIKLNTPTLLRKELKTQAKKAVCLWGYQPAEKEYGLMRKTLEVLYHRNFPVHVITRSDLVAKDVDILKKISDNSKCYVSMILNTIDKDISKIFEPNAPSPKKRLSVLSKMAELGIPTGVIVMPVIPHITDSKGQLEAIIKKAKELKSVYAIQVPLNLDDNYRQKVIEKIKKHYPKQMIKYRKLYEFGAKPDIKYTKNLNRNMRSHAAKYLLEDEVPISDYSKKVKQVKLEGY
jgi:DNA repair photolyase